MDIVVQHVSPPPGMGLDISAFSRDQLGFLLQKAYAKAPQLLQGILHEKSPVSIPALMAVQTSPPPAVPPPSLAHYLIDQA